MKTIGYEVQAMNGDEMPEGLKYPDQILYLGLRLLYDQYKKGIVPRETAVKEKRLLLAEYKNNQFHSAMCEKWYEIIKQTELARAAYRKNPCAENAMALINAIEGGKNENYNDREPDRAGLDGSKREGASNSW